MKFPKYKTVKLDEEDKAHHEEAEQEEKKAAEEQRVFLGVSYPHGRLDVEVVSLPSSFSCSCSSSSFTRQML